MSSQLDTNVDNYTIDELLEIIDMDNSEYDYDSIVENTNYYIKKYDTEGDSKLSLFFQDIQYKLLSTFEATYEDGANEDGANEDEGSVKKQTTEWYTNEVLKQSDPIQTNKITDRKQKIDVYKNDHVPMNQKQLGVNNTFSIPVAQDTLNPNLKNVTSRFINLDSQFRQSSSGIGNTSSDYTLDLSEQLTNVLSLRLYSIQIPFAWYTIDTVYGNTCFWLVVNENIIVKIYIEPGNYNPNEFVSQLNMGGYNGNVNFKDDNFVFPSTVSANYPVSYNSNTGKISMSFNGASYKDPTTGDLIAINSNTTKIVFFDIYAILTCNSASCNQSNTIDQTLGWLMGYRVPYVFPDSSGNVNAVAILDLYGPKYLILALDDYNQNHINNGLVSITEISSTLKLPSYYNPSIPVICNSPTINLDSNMETSLNNGDLLMDKLNLTYKKIPQVLPTNPRLLTQTQIYTINEILKNNEKNTNFRTKAPTTTDTFALLPMKRGNNSSTGDMYIEFGGTMQDNKRIYFGPVNIERMRLKLLDDKGNVLNLNGADWSCTLISENLYQY